MAVSRIIIHRTVIGGAVYRRGCRQVNPAGENQLGLLEIYLKIVLLQEEVTITKER